MTIASPVKSMGMPLAWVLLLTIAVTVVYLPAIRGGFIWDDDSYLTDNRNLLSADGLKRIWLEPRSSPQYYPLVFTTFWLERRLWGLDPRGYHLVNVLLHAANAALVWVIVRRLSLPGAWLAAGIFALHPVHVESVAWVTERKNVLSAALYLGAAASHLYYTGILAPGSSARRRWWAYGAALALFALAILAKSVTSSLPAALLLVLWWKRGRINWHDVYSLLPMFILGGLAGVHTIYLERHHVGAHGADWDLSFLERALLAGRVVWFYAVKLFWPAPLIFFYPRWDIDSHQISQYAFPLGAALIFVLLWGRRRRLGRGPLVAALFFAGTLFPVLGFFDIYPMRFSYVADHFQYLGSLGVIVPASAVLSGVALRLEPAGGGRLLRLAGGAILLLLGSLTWRQSRIYASEETLWRETIAKNPSAFLAHTNLGVLLERQGRYAEAKTHYEESLRIKPDFADTHYNLGVIFDTEGDSERAQAAYERTLRLKPDYADAYNNLGILRALRGDLERAREDLAVAIRIDPGFAKAHFNMGVVLERQGRHDEARSHYRQALRMDPGHAQARTRLEELSGGQ